MATFATRFFTTDCDVYFDIWIDDTEVYRSSTRWQANSLRRNKFQRNVFNNKNIKKQSILKWKYGTKTLVMMI